MRSLRLVVCAAALASAVGCDFMRKQLRPSGDGAVAGTGDLPPVNADLLVGYLNERAGRMQSLYFNDVWARCWDNRTPLPALNGVMDCSQPRFFRMKSSTSIGGGEIDMGSNADQFWVYVKAGREPVYVFASHTDFEQGKAKLPGDIPFEPGWVMQVLGMMKYPEDAAAYTVTPSRADRTYTLSWPDKTPQGPVVKEVVFEADDNIGSRPRVRRHAVKDAAGKKVIAFADVKKVGSQVLGPPDPKTGYGMPVQYPMDVTLRWEEQKFEMQLELRGVRINDPMTAEREKRFQRPNIRGVNAHDLARYEYRPTGRGG